MRGIGGIKHYTYKLISNDWYELEKALEDKLDPTIIIKRATYLSKEDKRLIPDTGISSIIYKGDVYVKWGIKSRLR